jgi:hypothetical protein
VLELRVAVRVLERLRAIAPLLRRLFTTFVGSTPARASSRPLRTVLMAVPVTRATAATPL